MSAIFGIINKDGSAVDVSAVKTIQNALSHRAADGVGAYLHENAAFGHCRLYVQPRQQSEDQPYSIDGLVITADARIDNCYELSGLLGLNRNRVLELSDDRLILQAYRKWGESCVAYLEGEYAFAIWDRSMRRLFAATDHIGFRPFFYYDAPDVFIFCSEIKGVVAAKKPPDYFEEESLIEYFCRKGTPDKTYNKEVFALCGGNTLTLADGKIAVSRYWELESTGKYRFTADRDWYDCACELLCAAVEKRLSPDAPTGITLSGGLDSTGIACILSELLMKKNKPLYAFSSALPVDYRGIEKDERQYIEIVGKHCPNIIQTFVEAPGTGPLSNLEEAFKLEETFPNSFFYMDRALAEAAREKHINNLFSGFGGDYWFSNKGNSVIYLLIKQRCYKTAFRLLRQLVKNENGFFPDEIRKHYLSHTRAYKGLRSVVKMNETDWREKTFLQDDILKKYAARLRETESAQTVSAKMKQTIETGRISRILYMLYNRNGFYKMSSSIPLFDKNLMEFLYDLPERLLVENGMPRNLLRSSVKHLIPRQIYDRIDKLPYAPGFPVRVLSQRCLFEKISAGSASAAHRQFIKSGEIMEHFDEVRPFKGFGRSDKIVDIRIAHAGITSVLLDHLSANGYIIENSFSH
jgi:asparagine synthase (glutamine-hydrolysing)